MKARLSIDNLSVNIEDKEILRQLELRLAPGELTVITGKNGSGKSSLAMVLLGSGNYQVVEGSRIEFEGEDVLIKSVDERARLGIYVTWQNPIAIPGVSVLAMCKAIYEAHGNRIEKMVEFKKQVESLVEKVGLSKAVMKRSVHDGFSGGERKRLELLFILILRPKLIVLDEIDSGLDERGREMVVALTKERRSEGASIILVTHYGEMIKELKPKNVWEMRDGRLYPRI